MGGPCLVAALLALVSGCGVSLVTDDGAPSAGSPLDDDPDAAPGAGAADATEILAVCDPEDPAGSIRQVAGIESVVEQECGTRVAAEGARCFTLGLRQPVSHAEPAGASFVHKLLLIHRGCDRPTVVADYGYRAFSVFHDRELETLFDANSLWIEHRYHGESVPEGDAWSWSALTIENGARDMHAAIVALRHVYGGRWVSTGGSKGGITAIYHRYFFPDDVDGSVPYVAPASRARIDPAYQPALAAALPDDCGGRVKQAQLAMLSTSRAAMVQRLTAEVGAASAELYLEAYLRTFDWAFWQYHGLESCPQVPGAGAGADALWQFFLEFSGFSDPPDEDPEAQASIDARSYEWLTQQGFALQIGDDVRELITAPGVLRTMEDRFRESQPDVALPAYDGSLTTDVRRWLRDEAERMVLIYGELDPWSGGALEAPIRSTSASFVVPGGTHYSYVLDLPPAERDIALSLIEPMFGAAPQLARRHAARSEVVREALRQRAADLGRELAELRRR